MKMKVTSFRLLCALAVLCPEHSSAFMGSRFMGSSKKAPQRAEVVPIVEQLQTVSIHPGEDTTVINEGGALALGRPISFETSLFKGQFLMRLRNSPDCDPVRHAQYFAPSDRKTRLMQMVVQGQFLKPGLKMSDVYVGSVLNQPLANPPPAIVTKVLVNTLRKVQPGAIVDLDCACPKFVALYAGSAQSISMDADPDSAPDILAPLDCENFLKHDDLSCPDRRQKFLAHPKHASQYEFDTDHTYTFHSFNEFVDFGTGHVKVPLLGEFDIKPTFGPANPFKVSAISGAGETLYSFEIRHHANLSNNQLKP